MALLTRLLRSAPMLLRAQGGVLSMLHLVEVKGGHRRSHAIGRMIRVVMRCWTCPAATLGRVSSCRCVDYRQAKGDDASEECAACGPMRSLSVSLCSNSSSRVFRVDENNLHLGRPAVAPQEIDRKFGR